jgi:transposase-like protein
VDTISNLLSGFSMQPQRRSYSKSFKAQVIHECSQPGASIANIALSHSLNANLVHKWIRVQAQKITVLQPAFIPLPLQLAGRLKQAKRKKERACTTLIVGRYD